MIGKKLLLLASIAAIIFLLVLSGGQAAEAKAKLLIGHLEPFTGSAGYWGEATKLGIDLAVEEINAKGGVNGQEIEVVRADEKCEPQEALSGMELLIGKYGVHMIIGPMCSSSTLAVMPLTKEKKVITIGAPGHPGVTGTGHPYTLRWWTMPEQDMPDFLNYTVKELGWKNYYGVFLNNDWGQISGKAFEKNLNELGANIVGIDYFKQGTKDFYGLLSKVKAKKPDLFWFVGYEEETISVIRQFRELNIGAQFSGSYYCASEFVKSALGDLTKGVTASGYFLVQGANAEALEFENKFKTKYPKVKSSLESAWGYYAMKFLIACMEEARTNTDVDKIVKIARSGFVIDTALGPLGFDKTGQATLAPMVVQIQANGKLEPILIGGKKAGNFIKP